MLGEGDERISALPLVDLLRPVAPLVEHLLIETEPKEKLYSTLKKAHKMIVSRSTEPVTVEMWCDRDLSGARVRFRQVAAPGSTWLNRWRSGRRESVDDERGVPSSLEQEAVEAPRCLLAIVDPGIKHVAIPMDGAVLDARLVDIASYVVLRDDPSEGRARRELDGFTDGAAPADRGSGSSPATRRRTTRQTARLERVEHAKGGAQRDI